MKNLLLFFVALSIFSSFGCGSVVENATVSGNGSIVQTSTNCKSGLFSFSYQNGNLNGSFCDDGKIHMLNATGVALTGNINSTEIDNFISSQGFVNQTELAIALNNSTNNTTVAPVFNGCYNFPKNWNITCENNSFVSSSSQVFNLFLNNSSLYGSGSLPENDTYGIVLEVSCSYNSSRVMVCDSGSENDYVYATALSNCVIIGNTIANAGTCYYTTSDGTVSNYVYPTF